MSDGFDIPSRLGDSWAGLRTRFRFPGVGNEGESDGNWGEVSCPFVVADAAKLLVSMLDHALAGWINVPARDGRVWS